MENPVNISFIVPWIHVFSFMMLYNQVLSCLEVENHVNISFIVLYNQLLRRLKKQKIKYVSLS